MDRNHLLVLDVYVLQYLKYLVLGGLLLMSASCILLGQRAPPFSLLDFYWPGAMYSLLEVGSGLTQVSKTPRAGGV